MRHVSYLFIKINEFSVRKMKALNDLQDDIPVAQLDVLNKRIDWINGVQWNAGLFLEWKESPPKDPNELSYDVVLMLMIIMIRIEY